MAEVIEGQRTFTVEEYHRMGEAGVFGPSHPFRSPTSTSR